MPYVDYDYLKVNPKIIIGYSDVTALLLAIYAKTGLVTYYGPTFVASFGEMSPFVDWTYEYFFSILAQNSPRPYILPTPFCWTDEFLPREEQDRSKVSVKNSLITLQSGKVRGRLIGGNLNTMEGIWGTEYMPGILDGDILFIEDALKNPMIIERSFSLLKCSKIFDRIGGLVLGKHEKFDDMKTGLKPYEILQEVIGKVDFPILVDLDCSHTHPMLTLPIGVDIELDADAKTVTLL